MKRNKQIFNEFNFQVIANYDIHASHMMIILQLSDLGDFGNSKILQWERDERDRQREKESERKEQKTKPVHIKSPSRYIERKYQMNKDINYISYILIPMCCFFCA